MDDVRHPKLPRRRHYLTLTFYAGGAEGTFGSGAVWFFTGYGCGVDSVHVDQYAKLPSEGRYAGLSGHSQNGDHRPSERPAQSSSLKHLLEADPFCRLPPETWPDLPAC